MNDHSMSGPAIKNRPIDPITLSVLWNGLLSMAEEMGTTRSEVWRRVIG